MKYGLDSSFARIGMLVAGIAVAHVAQPDRAGHVLQLAIAIGGAGQAVQRMIGDVELHHALAQALEPLGLGAHHHSGGDRRRAGGRRPGAPLDLDQAQPARAERVEHVGRAELRNLRSHLHRGTHDRGAFRHRDGTAVDGQRHRLLALRAAACRSRSRTRATWLSPSFRSLQARRCAEILGKMGERAHHRIRREAAERAQRAELHGVAEVFEHREVSPPGPRRG